MNKDQRALVIVRLGLGMFFLLFSLSKFTNPDYWFGYIPSWFTSTAGLIGNTHFIYLLGLFELTVGILLIAGLFTRFAAGMVVVLMLPIVASQLPNEVAIRDIGLLFMALALALTNTEFSLDKKIRLL